MKFIGIRRSPIKIDRLKKKPFDQLSIVNMIYKDWYSNNITTLIVKYYEPYELHESKILQNLF